MAKEVVTCGPEDDVAAVTKKMSAHKIRRVPVVDRTRRPGGIVLIGDPARATVSGTTDREAITLKDGHLADDEHRHIDAARLTRRWSDELHAEGGDTLVFDKWRATFCATANGNSAARKTQHCKTAPGRPWLRERSARAQVPTRN